MARTSLAERLAKIEEQKRQLEGQERALRARVTHERRKLETRQRILLGAFILHQLERSGPSIKPVHEWIAKELPAFLTKARDHEALAEILTAVRNGVSLPRTDIETKPG